MKIEKAEFIPLRIQGTSTLRISKGATHIAHSVIIRLETDEGITGFGEVVSSPPGYPEELQEEIMAALKYYFQPHLLGHELGDIPDIRAKLDRAVNGRYWTKAAIITALYDIMGKVRKLPVCELLGGTWQEKLPNLPGMVGIDTPENMVKKAMSFIENGATTVKLKIGQAVEADADRVMAVRQAVGPNVGIRVDANSYYEAHDAIRLIRKIQKYHVLHVEAPVDKNDILGMMKVNQSVDVPIMSDESVRIPIEARNLIQLNAVDIIKVKVTKMGFDGVHQIVSIAEENGKKCILGQMLELGIAGTAEAHCALAHPALIQPHEIGSYRLLGIHKDIIRDQVVTDPNYFSPPRGYGLGITLNEEIIESNRVD